MAALVARWRIDNACDVAACCEHCGQQRQGCDLFLLSRDQYRSRTTKDGPADAKSERVRPLGAGDVQDNND